MNEYDAAVAASMAPDAAQSARVGVSVAADTNPDAYAEAQRVARRTGVPVDTAMALPGEMKKQSAMGSINFDSLAATSPETAALLANVEKAKIAHDDVDNLTGIESLLYGIGKFEVGTGKAIASAVPKFNEGMWGVARAGAEAFVPDALGKKPTADYFARMGGTSRATADGLMTKASGLIESSWYSGMQSLGLNAILLPVSLASGGSMAPMLAGMGASTGGAAYGEARDKGVPVPQALAFGVSQGVIEAGTEMIGMPALFSLLKPGQFARKAAEYMVRDQGGEQIATHLQDLNEWATLTPEKTIGDYLKARPGAAAQTALATAFGGGGQVALMKGVEIIASRNDIKVDSANQTAELLGRLNEMGTASKVLSRDADTFAQHVQAIADNGPAPDAVFISAQTLQQSGLADQIAALSPAVAEQFQTALETGGDVRIPVGEYAANIAPTPLAQDLADHLKFDPEGFTRAEAQTYMQEKAPELQAEVDRVLGEQSADETWKASAQEVEDAVFTELQTAGRFTESVNRTDAVLHKAFASVMAAKLGMTPMRFFQDHTLRVIAEKDGGAKFDQSGSIPGMADKDAVAGTQAPTSAGDGSTGSAITLYTGSFERVPSIKNKGAYGGLFASVSRDSALSHGDVLHEIILKESEIMSQSDMNNVSDDELIKVAPNNFSPDDLDQLRGLVVNDRKATDSDVDMLRVEDRTEASIEGQRLRGELAKLKGFKAVEMNDEHGTSYLVLPGANIRAVDQSEKSTSAGSDVLKQGDRGSFNPATNTVALLKNADLSTFLHESGHFFLEVQSSVASQLAQDAVIHGADTLKPGERQILDDHNALLAWFGVKGISEWNNLDFEEKRAYHEQFARSFESYLFEGKAPSIELHGVFQRFRAWLLNVYKSLDALNVEITDEVRGVFDRMLATTEQIQLAEQGRSMMPLFERADQAGMTPKDFAAYQALGIDATSAAIEELQGRGLRDMQWLHNARGRIVKQLQKESAARRAEVKTGVRSEVLSQPIYRAWEYLTGRDKDTSTDGAIEDAAGNRWSEHGRIDRASMDDMGLPPEVVARIDALRMVKRDALHPDIVAELFGFSSGDELVRTLAASDKPSDVIEGMTDQRMLEQYGDLSSQEAIEKAADKAIHNDVRARMVATEANALANATGKPKILASAAKEFAAAIIARLKVRNIKPGQYANAEARAAKAAKKASQTGDLETAGAEKRNQLINNYATRAAYDAQTEVEKLRRDWSAFANRSDDKLKKAYDMDLVNAVRAILGEYGVAEKKAKRALDYLETVKTQDPEMYGIISASVDSASQSAKPFKEMTVEEVRGLADEIAAILHLAKRSRQMEIDGDLMDRRDVEDALRARMVEIGVPDDMPGDTQAITAGETRMLKFKTALASMTRAESWVGKMDGMAPFGPFRRFIWARIKDSADAYRADKAKYLKQLRVLFDSVAPSLKPGLIYAPELGYTFGKDSGGSAINEVLHAILHTGNESNLRKLLLGRNWASESAEGVVDTSRWDRFIDRMAKDGKITKAHFDFAQGVWDLLESTKPLAQKTHRDVFGKYFDEVTAAPRNTPFGIYAGGYVPAQSDSRIVADANLRALSESENASMAFAFPSTAKGFTKARVEYNRPLLLDLRTLSQHIDKVLLFSHMEMPVRDVQRVVGAVSGTLNRIDPAAIAGLLTPWLNRAARQQVTTPITADAGLSRFLMTMRSRAGAAAMFGNLANAVQQITGFSIAAVKVKPGLLLSSSVDFLKGPRKFVAAVAEASPFMADRMLNEVSAMNDDINQILLNPTVLESGQAWMMRHAYFLQSAIDNSMSPIIWTAAYNQALEQGLGHKDAVRLGDSAVRETQGSTLPEDVSRIESGPAWARLFTQFAGYFNMQANLLGTEYAKLMQEYGLRKGAGRGLYVFALGFIAPAIAGELVMQVFRGGPPDDDKDGEYLDDWLAALLLWAPLRNATAMIPVAGSILNSSINAWNGKPYDDRIASSPAVSMLESAAKAPVSAYKALTDGGGAQKAVRDVATLISMTVGLPANLAARPAGYLAGVADGKINPTGPVDAARGIVTGIASPESKR